MGTTEQSHIPVLGSVAPFQRVWSFLFLIFAMEQCIFEVKSERESIGFFVCLFVASFYKNIKSYFPSPFWEKVKSGGGVLKELCRFSRSFLPEDECLERELGKMGPRLPSNSRVPTPLRKNLLR